MKGTLPVGTAASDATRVHKHRLGAYGHGGQSHHAYIGGPRGVLADSRAPFCEYAIRGRIPLFSCLQAPSGRMRLWWTYLPCESRRPRGVNIAYWRPRFANTLLQAVWRCITLGSCRHAPKRHHSQRRLCKNRESSRCRRDIAFSRAQFGEIRNARQSTAASYSAWVSTHQTHINLDSDRVKTGNQ